MKNITVSDLSALLDRKSKVLFIDVRTKMEYDMLNIGGNRIAPTEIESLLPKLERWKSELVVVACSRPNSKRTPSVCGALATAGFQNVKTLQGGIYAWTVPFGKGRKIPAIAL